MRSIFSSLSRRTNRIAFRLSVPLFPCDSKITFTVSMGAIDTTSTAIHDLA